MAVNTVVTAAADVNTQMDSDSLNPTVTSAASTGNKKIIHITLEVENADIDINDIYDALDAEFAVVGSPKSTLSRGTYIFNIGPA